jgi:hypothetical protein
VTIVEQRDGFLVLRQRPWLVWAAAAVALAVGAIIAFQPWLSPALVCAGGRCTLRTDPFSARTFRQGELRGADVEPNANRPRMGRLVIIVGDERIVFDQRSATLTELNALAERVDAGGDLAIGDKGDLDHALILLSVAALIAIVMASGSRSRRIIFDAGKGTLTVARKKHPLSDARRLVLTRDGALQKLALELASGEQVPIAESLATNVAFQALQAAVAKFVQ